MDMRKAVGAEVCYGDIRSDVLLSLKLLTV
jgi:hypothetical protein